MLFEYADIHKAVPPNRKTFNNYKVGSWYGNQINKIENKNDKIYCELCLNKYVKLAVDKYLENRRKNKNTKKQTWEEWKELLFSYCNKFNDIPRNKSVYKNYHIGYWLQHQKKKLTCSECDTYIKLSANSLVKSELDRFLSRKLRA